MRRLAVTAAVGCALAMAFACGGGAFSTAPGENDASLGDGPTPDVATPDAPVPDGSMSEAAGGNDGASSDSPEEPPAHCDGEFECVPAVPGGWTGPLELYFGSSAAPSCPGVEKDVFDGMEGLMAPAAMCGCSCGSPAIICSSVDMTTYDLTGCATKCATTVTVSGACFTTVKCAGSSITGAFQTLSTPTAAGSCPPQATTGTTPPSWTEYTRACAPALMLGQIDCPTGQVCTRKPAEAPFQTGVCILQSGTPTCPAAYGVQHLEYTGVDDGRGCTACTCGEPMNLTCTADLNQYSTTNGTCSGNVDSFDSPVTCNPTNAVADMKVVITPSSGPCTASDVSPVGAATPTGPSTICCTQ
jgi:hypothetical protein